MWIVEFSLRRSMVATVGRSHELVKPALLKVDCDHVVGIEPVLASQHRSHTVKLHRARWGDGEILVERQASLLCTQQVRDRVRRQVALLWIGIGTKSTLSTSTTAINRRTRRRAAGGRLAPVGSCG